MLNCNSPELRRARWGLIPFWAKDEKIGNSLINARGETVATKPSFRTSFKKKRCLVLADGFFEWKKVAGGKQPIYIRLREGRPFVFAGLWDRWNEKDSFTVITTTPNDLCSKVHDRMPAILGEKDFTRWLDPATHLDEVSAMIRPHSESEMECFPVSRLVNSPKTDSAECVQRIDSPMLFSLQ